MFDTKDPLKQLLCYHLGCAMFWSKFLDSEMCDLFQTRIIQISENPDYPKFITFVICNT